MRGSSLWQKALDLTDRVSRVTSGLALPRGNQWPTTVTVFLTQANELLDSIRVLLGKNYCASSEILTRSLFEFAVNLAYIAKDASARLPEYLRHGGIPTTTEEAEKLQEELQEGGQPEVKDIVAGQAWKLLRDMCADLGSDWLEEYGTFYRVASVPTHAGAFTLAKNYLQLSQQQSPSEDEKVGVLITATDFHLRVAEIAAKTFPEQINAQAITELRTEVRQLGSRLIQKAEAAP